ncbi:MAG: metal-dependent hydrolase [Chlorobiaceae bacterium]|nr:metal-dependent hydrolase [Chlorobiaceae bacterium]
MKKLVWLVHCMTFSIFMVLPVHVFATSPTELKWYGQSAFKITTPSGKVLLIDPWITNPLNKNSAVDLAALNKADLIMITHGHSDHIGNALEIAKKTGAKLVANFDLGRALVQYGGFPEKQAERSYMAFPGGELNLLDGEVRILFVPAVHSSIVEGAEGSPLPGKIVYGGSPGGFVVSINGGPTIYHTGDTDVFSDMALIGSLNKIDIMLVCIGGHFTMGPQRAALATKLVNPGIAVPMHFGSNPLLKGTPEQFAKELAALKKNGQQPTFREMAVGEILTWKAK